MNERPLSISEIYDKGMETLKEKGVAWGYPGGIGPSVRAARKYLDSLFFEPKFLNPVEVDTSLTIFGAKLRTPVFCSAISKVGYMSETGIADVARGVADAGSFIMLGIGSTDDLQSAIDTGAPVVKIVKPYRDTGKIYEEARDGENRGCIAIGMDIDHFYGVLIGDGKVRSTNTFAPQPTKELKQLISQTRLPFIVKGVLSVQDAEQAVELGASAIVVSNHGSASVDFSVPSVIALPRIVESVGDKLTVLVDTGFETGNDALKALALGAKAVGFASSMVLALIAGGSKGVELLINQITAELHRTMAATGCASLSAITKLIITQVPSLKE